MVEPQWEHCAAEALRRLALDEDLKAYVLQRPELYQPLLRAALRFIGGETLPHCVTAAKELNAQGHAVTIDYMGESTRDAAMAEQALREFLTVVDAIRQERLTASVSFDLSHIGMVIDTELTCRHAAQLAQAARDAGLELMISMESTDRTDSILSIHRWLGERFDNVGITLQAYLFRTAQDLAEVLKRPGKIRLVKGAYGEAAHVARSRGEGLDAEYRRLVEAILASGHLLSIATHDTALLAQAHCFIQERGLKSDLIEFEMLKGVAPERLQVMRARGYRTRVYLPYGQEWHLYLCNRLAEYPPNIYQAIADAAG
jgi:proline dehydrogenase